MSEYQSSRDWAQDQVNPSHEWMQQQASKVKADFLSYDPPDSDYGRIFTQARIIAWQYGFALLTHGSRTRDLDVLMVPWEARAYERIVPAVINRIAEVTGTTLKGEPTEKPHGRKAYTLFLPDGVRWVDLSVMPCAASS